MRARQVIGKRLTYSNVTATLALCIALGGASYAAIVLPRNSVGTSQVRAGAITPNKLSFPLGVATSTATTPITITGYPCPLSCPPPMPSQILTLTSITLKHPGQVLLLASARMSNADPNGAAEIHLGTKVGDKIDIEEVGLIQEAESVSFSFHRVRAARAGRQTFSLVAAAIGQTEAEPKVNVERAKLTAIVLPVLR